MTTQSAERPTFNVLDQPWIPCLMLDGSMELLSIKELFRRAGQIRVIEAELPTVTFALHRLLIAVLYRALLLEPRADAMKEWIELWRDPSLPIEDIEAYLATFHARFDLLHPVAPFFQVADLRTTKGEFSGLEKLIADVPNGEAYFTTRAGRRLRSIGFAEAVRWVVHCQAFDPSGIKSGAVGDDRVKGGKGYPIGTAWAGNLGGVLLEGSDLRETLLLNLPLGVLGGSRQPWSIERDLPVWEREPQGAAEDPGADVGDIPGRTPTGPADLLTWQSRRIRLQVDSDQVVGVLIANGDQLWPQNRFPAEPHSGWRHSEPQTKKYKTEVYMPRQHLLDRAMWRGLGSILPTSSGTVDSERSMAAANVKWQRTLQVEEGFEDILVRPRAIGIIYGAQSSVISDVYDDALLVHSVLLSDPDLQAVAVLAVARADDAVYALGSLSRNLDIAAGGMGDGARESARERAYHQLDRSYREWVAQLTAASVLGDELQTWTDRVRRAIERLGQQSVDEAGPAAWRGRSDGTRHVDVGRAVTWFDAELRKVLPRQKGRTVHDKEVTV